MGELIETYVAAPVQSHFSEGSMGGRVQGYQHSTVHAHVHSLIESQGGARTDSDSVEGRLAELKGLPKPANNPLKR